MSKTRKSKRRTSRTYPQVTCFTTNHPPALTAALMALNEVGLPARGPELLRHVHVTVTRTQTRFVSLDGPRLVSVSYGAPLVQAGALVPRYFTIPRVEVPDLYVALLRASPSGVAVTAEAGLYRLKHRNGEPIACWTGDPVATETPEPVQRLVQMLDDSAARLALNVPANTMTLVETVRHHGVYFGLLKSSTPVQVRAADNTVSFVMSDEPGSCLTVVSSLARG